MAEYKGAVEVEWPAENDGLPLYSGDLRVIDASTKEVLPGLTSVQLTIAAQVGSVLELRATQLTVGGKPYQPGANKVTPDMIGQGEFFYKIMAMRVREKK
jgi:hypothetical protein